MTAAVALVAVVVAAAVGMTLVWLAFDAAAYRPLRRAAARGDIDASPGDHVRPFRLNALGTNPDLEYRYALYSLPPGQVLVLHGQIPPGSAYYSVVVYDRLLQTVPRGDCPGPTMRAARHLATDGEGRFTAVLARTDRGWPHWLDVSAIPDGVIFERHVGAAPEALARFEVLPEEEAAARYTDLDHSPGPT